MTALNYHFATQCIPTPLAWYMHQLPPVLLKLGTAVTFYIEIPAAVMALLLRSPTRMPVLPVRTSPKSFPRSKPIGRRFKNVWLVKPRVLHS